MTILKASHGVLKDEILVLGLASVDTKGGIVIEPGDLALDTKAIVASLIDMGATGSADEVI